MKKSLISAVCLIVSMTFIAPSISLARDACRGEAKKLNYSKKKNGKRHEFLMANMDKITSPACKNQVQKTEKRKQASAAKKAAKPNKAK